MTSAIKTYRQQIRQSRTQERGYRPGKIWRSRREDWSTLVFSTSVCLVIAIPVSLAGFSLLVHLAVVAGIASFSCLCWFIWIVWGREAFPLPDQPDEPPTA